VRTCIVIIDLITEGNKEQIINNISEILKSGKYKSHENGPVFQKTELGWVVAGLITDKTTTNVQTFVAQATNKEHVDPLQNQLAKFWKLEEITTTNHYDQDEKRCVEHFENTVKRGDDGKFVIQLPLTINLDIQDWTLLGGRV